jgi:hypothetical protein
MGHDVTLTGLVEKVYYFDCSLSNGGEWVSVLCIGGTERIVHAIGDVTVESGYKFF